MESAKIFTKGLQYDRRYMLAGADGVAMTQRQFPKMALFKTSIKNDQIHVAFQDETISFPAIPNPLGEKVSAKVWDDNVNVVEPDRSYSRWFSGMLETDCRLLFFPESNSRPVDEKFGMNGEHVSLADAYPILIIGEMSLADLNSKLEEPVFMNRFRPNFVFSGGSSFDEDKWKNFTIGDSKFTAVKPCSRCTLTTVNQETSERTAEPLKTLAGYRTQNNKVHFGQNVIARSATSVRKGDLITVESYR
jgi:uncharacterized protein